jgi:RNA polymerase sigma-70 factor (ECF subfamily)
MIAAEEVAELMARLRAGDQEAARLVFGHFAHRLIALARHRLDPLLRRKVDPEDVIQSVFRTFFARQADGRLRVDSWESLWGLLTAITLRKCGRHIDHFQAACRDVRRERTPEPAGDDSSAGGWEAVDAEPTPFQAALLADTLEQLLHDLDERDRQILQLSLQGEDPPRIGAAVGCSERTVKRVLERIRQRLEQLRDGGPDQP